MPKLAYDKHYGALAMFPFPFGWLSVLALPLLSCSKDKQWLQNANGVLMHIVYFPVMVFLLIIFMAVNLVLIPLAYLKTIGHKVALLSRYRSSA